MVNWDNMVTKMASFEALDILAKHGQYAKLRHTLEVTWRTSSAVGTRILAMFFARYPHRNGICLQNEVDDFYDSTYRGQGQVDLWMMGEGPHHMHHAKGDVPYCRLSQVCEEVEAARPDIKCMSRGVVDTASLETGNAMPERMSAETPPPIHIARRRTNCVEEGKDALLAGRTTEALLQISTTVLETALHIATTADRKLLSKISKDMDISTEDPDVPSFEGSTKHPLPQKGWADTVFSEETSEKLIDAQERIASKVRSTAEKLASIMPVVNDENELKQSYFDYFVALWDVMVPSEQQQEFARCGAQAFSGVKLSQREAVVGRIRNHLRSSVPADFRRKKSFGAAVTAAGSRRQTRQRLSHLLFGKVSSSL